MGTVSVLQGPGDVAIPRGALFGGPAKTRGTQDVVPCLSPTDVRPFQTSKNAKHVAQGGGGDVIAAAAQGLYLRAAGPRAPQPRREGSTEALRPFPACQGAAEGRAPAGVGGELLARGPADFLQIPSRKPACARCGRSGAWGAGPAPPARGDPGS